MIFIACNVYITCILSPNVSIITKIVALRSINFHAFQNILDNLSKYNDSKHACQKLTLIGAGSFKCPDISSSTSGSQSGTVYG